MPAPLDITCRIGVCGKVTGLPTWPLEWVERPLNEYFEEAAEQGGVRPLRLRFDYSAVETNPLPTLTAVSSRQLHEQLASLLHNPVEGNGVRRVGVVLAPLYSPPKGADFFGIMFDRGFDEWDDNNTFYQGVPREGCAVFVDAIKARRAPDEYKQEIAFTVAHELGHVFNLWHVRKPVCLMTRSAESPAVLAPQVTFSERQKLFLGHVGESRFVWPGGSAFRDRNGLIHMPPDDTEGNRAGGRYSALTLRLAITPPSFFPWEPVELDVTLALAAREAGATTVPDAVDPSYGCFRIWIEGPDGERSLYRPPRYYCGTRRRLRIGRTTPFQRDVTVFVGAGGYTFRRAGRHQVRAEFDVGRRGCVRSNVVTVDVKPQLKLSARERLRCSYLTQPSVVRLLYHRSAHPRSQGPKLLADYVERDPHSFSGAAAAYALGRAYEVSACDTGGDRDRGQVLRERSRHYLRHALDADVLSPHRQDLALRSLRRLDEAD